MNFVLRFVSNKVKGRISKRVLQENKACRSFWKTNISYPLICTCTCAYQGLRNASCPPAKHEKTLQFPSYQTKLFLFLPFAIFLHPVLRFPLLSYEWRLALISSDYIYFFIIFLAFLMLRKSNQYFYIVAWIFRAYSRQLISALFYNEKST